MEDRVSRHAFIPLLILIVLFSSCSPEGSIYQPYEPFCIFEPYLSPTGADTGYASVVLSRADVEIPEYCYIDGMIYRVGVFGGFTDPSVAVKLSEIKLPSYITAISSHAYEQASMIRNTTVPESVTSLGKSCLPATLTSITVPAEAICSTGTAELWNALSSPSTLRELTVTGTAQSSVNLKKFGTEESSLQRITVKGTGAVWPQMPHMAKEGMKFLGWYTKDPSDPAAVKAVSGEKLSMYSMTVRPYWTEGADEGDPETDPPVPMGPLRIYRVYSFGINREYIHITYSEETDEYTVSLDTTHWFWKWAYNGKPVEMENSSTFTFRKASSGRTQVTCFQYDAEGKVSGGAVMIEV